MQGHRSLGHGNPRGKPIVTSDALPYVILKAVDPGKVLTPASISQ